MANIVKFDLIPNNTSQIDINKSYLSDIDINKRIRNEIEITRQSQSISSFCRINKKSICVFACILLSFIIIGCSIFLIIFFTGIKKEDLIIESNKEENFVARYFEVKNSTSGYDFEELNETDIEQNNETDYNNTEEIDQMNETNYNDIDELYEININQNNKTNNNDTERLNETQIIQKKTLLTDFIIAINKKININENSFIGENKYLYETYLLIINLTDSNETDSLFLGGINVYNESVKFEQLIKINNDYFSDILISKESNNENSEIINSTSYKNKEVNIPFSKYSFFENGTLDKIYLPKYINEFYKSAIIDLIEKVTPKLSKSIYNNETNKRRLEEEKEGIYLDYEKIKRNGNLSKIILYEVKKMKDIDKEQYNFENTEMNSKIQRIFNPSGEMINLKMEGDIAFIDHNNNNNLRLIEENNETKVDSNDNTYYNLGIKKFKMNVTSNMDLIDNKIEKKTLEKLNKLNKMINWELYDNSTINTSNNSNNNTEELIISNVNNSGPINFVSTYTARYNIFDTSFLGMNLGMDQYLYINNNTGLRKGYVNLFLGGSEIRLSTIEKYHYANIEKGSDTEALQDSYFTIPKTFKPFGFVFKIKFKLKVYLSHEVSFGIKDEEMYAKGLVNYDIGLMFTFSVDLLIVEFGVGLTGHIVKGNSYINANTLLKIYPNWTKFTYSKQNYAMSVDLNFYFSVWLIFWKKTFQKNINIYKGIPISEYYYRFY